VRLRGHGFRSKCMAASHAAACSLISAVMCCTDDDIRKSIYCGARCDVYITVCTRPRIWDVSHTHIFPLPVEFARPMFVQCPKSHSMKWYSTYLLSTVLTLLYYFIKYLILPHKTYNLDIKTTRSIALSNKVKLQSNKVKLLLKTNGTNSKQSTSIDL